MNTFDFLSIKSIFKNLFQEIVMFIKTPRLKFKLIPPRIL